MPVSAADIHAAGVLRRRDGVQGSSLVCKANSEPPRGQVRPLVQRAGRLRARTDGDENPPLEQLLPEGGTGQESDGAVGGGQRRLRDDAGGDGGLGALPEEEEYGSLHGVTGNFAREIAREFVREIARDSGRKTW